MEETPFSIVGTARQFSLAANIGLGRLAMLIWTALRILWHEVFRYLGAVFGLGLALFLVLLQSGFYFGFRRDITVVQDSFAADLWITPKALLTFDYAVAFDDAAYWKALNIPGIAQAARVICDLALWRIPDTGGKESVQVLGMDFESGLRFDFGVPAPNAPALLRADGHIFVDAADATRLGVKQLGQEAEIRGRRVRVVGFMRGKKLFNTSCLVVTDLNNARRLLNVTPHHVSFVALRCAPGADPAKIAERLRQVIPEHDVLTSRELHNLTQHYWQSCTGIGPILFLSAGLAVLVGFFTVLLTFYLLTIQKLAVLAALKALGGSTGELALLLGTQAALVFLAGAALASGAVVLAQVALTRANISVIISAGTWATAFGLIALACAVACLPSLARIRRLEPADAFRA